MKQQRGKSRSALLGSTVLILALAAIPAAGADQPFALSDTCSISGLPQPLPSCVVTFHLLTGGKQYVLETTTIQASLGIGQVVMDLWLTGYLGGVPFTHFIPLSRADTVNSGFSYNVYAGALTDASPWMEAPRSRSAFARPIRSAS
jgi:hypothetical protein